ncbi:hypothetical protein GCM10010412_035360 [Nonomuraea recticatena]|uniref:Uncharacterized protein n=1 Tax=Nonomuraea recticatena TaxID=46178 RepID=A0ABN3RVP2_9ACTN
MDQLGPPGQRLGHEHVQQPAGQRVRPAQPPVCVKNDLVHKMRKGADALTVGTDSLSLGQAACFGVAAPVNLTVPGL